MLQKYGALFNNLRGEFDAHATTMARDKLKTLKRSPPPGPCKLHLIFCLFVVLLFFLLVIYILNSRHLIDDYVFTNSTLIIYLHIKKNLFEFFLTYFLSSIVVVIVALIN